MPQSLIKRLRVAVPQIINWHTDLNLGGQPFVHRQIAQYQRFSLLQMSAPNVCLICNASCVSVRNSVHIFNEVGDKLLQLSFELPTVLFALEWGFE